MLAAVAYWCCQPLLTVPPAVADCAEYKHAHHGDRAIKLLRALTSALDATRYCFVTLLPACSHDMFRCNHSSSTPPHMPPVIHIATIASVPFLYVVFNPLSNDKERASNVTPSLLCRLQEAASELTGASLVLATRCGLDQPQPVLDSEALAALVNVPTGRFCCPVSATAGHKFGCFCFFVSIKCICRVTSA